MPTPDRIGRYRIEGTLGRGGMGIVYVARDDRLGRTVAVKTIRAGFADDQTLKRFWREARAASSVNHPNVCQIYEVGEDDGTAFIAMEMLEGEPLSARMQRGPMTVPEAAPIALGVLAALGALHTREIVHRDVKPSNIFMTAHGVKLLDFGLARQGAVEADVTASVLTQPGTLLGTPRYMSPEQLRGQKVDLRTDLFSLAAVLFEMLAARVAFPGRTPAEIFHATLYENPPALAGSPAIGAVDLVIRRGLAKQPEDRYATAAAMADELRCATAQEDSGQPARARAITRLIALPFRMLRPDAETDFLAFSVPDAVTSALGGLQSLVVRSSLVAGRFPSAETDLQKIAAEADVDVVLTGTLLRSGEQIRVSTQLVEAPQGTVVCSTAATIRLADVFQLQDQMVQRIVDSLSLPLTAREHKMLQQDIPATPAAYEYYLRANKASLEVENWDLARDLYERCVEQDPRYAPAWARLARIYRVQAKYSAVEVDDYLSRAAAAFQRALELNPDLAIAHNLYTHYEVEAGRASEAITRLLSRARAGSADPELFAGLVTATRYCGQLEASLAADRHARRLDPAIRTSVAYTHFARGDYEEAMRTETQQLPYVRLYSLPMVGRPEEAVAEYKRMIPRMPPGVRLSFSLYLAGLEGDREGVLAAQGQLERIGFRDPEGIHYMARCAAYVGAEREALVLLEQVIDRGFFCPPFLRGDPWLASVRANPEFASLLSRADERSRAAQCALRDAGGEKLLGLAGW